MKKMLNYFNGLKEKAKTENLGFSVTGRTGTLPTGEKIRVILKAPSISIRHKNGNRGGLFKVKSFFVGETFPMTRETTRPDLFAALDLIAEHVKTLCSSADYKRTMQEEAAKRAEQARQALKALVAMDDPDDFETAVQNLLPSGSGFDCEWEISTICKGRKIQCKTAYHCLNENGFYDGYADFTVKIPVGFPAFSPEFDFSLEFNGSAAQWKNKKYALREYIEDTICLTITAGLDALLKK